MCIEYILSFVILQYSKYCWFVVHYLHVLLHLSSRNISKKWLFSDFSCYFLSHFYALYIIRLINLLKIYFCFILNLPVTRSSVLTTKNIFNETKLGMKYLNRIESGLLKV